MNLEAISLPMQVKRPPHIYVLVTGGRDYADVETEEHILDTMVAAAAARGLGVVVIQGGARGADAIARTWAWKRGLLLINEPARWNEHGKAAGPIRNQLMLDKHKPDVCLAMPGGRGTADMVSRCEAAGVLVLKF